jgi:sortase A
MLYTYTKDPNFSTTLAVAKIHKKIALFASLVFLALGLFLIGQVVYPIVSWYFLLLPTFQARIVSPLPAVSLVSAGEVVPTSFQPSTWFPKAKPFAEVLNSSLTTYRLSIPKLKIDDATVRIGGDDLKKSLIAWPTGAAPGNFGVNIIFGHSELPQFANPKEYSGIFTFLMDLSAGDVIYVDYDSVRYKYLVVDKKVVDPEDLSVLEQRFDDRYLTLITCVPPGTLWKRGIIKAVMSTI